MSATPRYRMTVSEAMQKLPDQATDHLRFATLLKRGSLRVEFYAPHEYDAQQPHDQDELYVVVAGHGDFINGTERHPFAPGDVLFVPAGVVHRFERFTNDFQTWVIFYGPDGGEQVEE